MNPLPPTAPVTNSPEGRKYTLLFVALSVIQLM